MRSALWLLALAGCAESVADNFAKPPPASGLTVEIGAVTLADDCAPPPPATKQTKVASKPGPASAVPADAPEPSAPSRAAPGFRAHCDQTTMQLKITTPADFRAGSVKVRKVELLDASGKYLQTLTARNPRAWKNTTSYSAWDEKIGAGDGINSMYDLTAPDWNKLTNGRWNAHSKTFQVRVIVEIGGNNKTVTKQAITAARLPPPVPT